MTAASSGPHRLTIRYLDHHGGAEVELVAAGVTLRAAAEYEPSRPRIVPGVYRLAYTPGLHRGRPALVQQGATGVALTDGRPPHYYGFHLHDRPTPTSALHGCIAPPIEWITSALALLSSITDRDPGRRWSPGVSGAGVWTHPELYGMMLDTEVVDARA